MEPRPSSPPPNGVANAPEPRSSSPPGVEPHTNDPLSSSPPFPSEQDAARTHPVNYGPRYNIERPVRVECKANEREWKFKIPKESLEPGASREVFMAAWRQSATPRGLLRKVDRDELRLLKMARVRAALHALSVDEYAASEGWCTKNAGLSIRAGSEQGGLQKRFPAPDDENRRLQDLFCFRLSVLPVMRPVTIYEADGRVHAIYAQFEIYGYKGLKKPAWRRRTWRTCVEFDSGGLFKNVDSVLLAEREIFDGDKMEMMRWADRVEEILTDNVDY